MNNESQNPKRFTAFAKLIILLLAAGMILTYFFAPFIEEKMQERYYENLFTIGDYVFSHDFPVGESIELDDFPKNSDAYKAFKAVEKDHLSIYLYNDHTIRITTEVIFHSVEGILVTDGTEIPDGHLSSPGFDGNVIRVNETETDRIYTWTGGL